MRTYKIAASNFTIRIYR